MLEHNLITLFTERLQRQHIEYMITGSVACIVYGEPRLTHDIDLVLVLHGQQLDAFLQEFPLETFYTPPKETLLLESQRATRAHFNVIHHATGFKADCYLAGNDPLHRWGLQHKQALPVGGAMLWLAPPEYVILRKLEYFQEGESNKHLEDIRRMLPHIELQHREWFEQQLQTRGLFALWTKEILHTKEIV